MVYTAHSPYFQKKFLCILINSWALKDPDLMAIAEVPDKRTWNCKSESEQYARGAETLKCYIFTGLLNRALTGWDLHLYSLTEEQTIVSQVT